MNDFKTISVDIDQRAVATITLQRAEKHNAMNADMIDEITQAAGAINAKGNIKVSILQAEGETFCAGGDLKWMQAQMLQSREQKMAGAGKLADMLQALDDLPCPLIGKVQGSAYGGGIGMMAVCDVVIASNSAKFALSETKLGLIPATIGPYVVRRIGEAWARQYFFSAKPFDCTKAMQMNLVSQCVKRGDLDALVGDEIEHLLQCRPGAVARAKQLAKTLARNPTMETRNYTAQKLADCWESDEAKSAIEAFFAKK